MNSKVTLHDGRHIRLVARNGWEYAERKKVTGIVGIVAVTDDNKLILVEQFRVPLQKNVIELPAGLAGDVAGSEHEPLSAAAQRELLEETGYTAQEMECLSEGAVSAGITDEIITLFRARVLEKTTNGGGDGTENITVHTIELAAVPRWLEERRKGGAVVDWKVYAGMYFLK